MTSRLERITQQRLEKLNRIKASGTDPYPHRYHRTHTAEQAVEQLHKLESKNTTEDTASVAGRIMAQRKMGKNVFIDLRDGSGKIQLLFQNINQFDQEKTELFDNLDIGDFIGVSGNLFRTRTGEPTIGVGDFKLLAKSLRPLPEKWHGLQDTDLRYRQRYLDLVSNPEVRDTFKVRSQVITSIRQFLNQRGFLEVETPVLQPSAGGALANPFITRHQALDQDFYLRIATELHLKRLIVGGFDRVYELGRTFRNEGIDTRHNPEFTLLESYEAYADYNDVMKMVEEMVSEISQQVLGTKEIHFDNATIDLSPPWRRITLREAVVEHSGIDFVKYPTANELREKMQSMNIEVDPDKNWAKLVDEILKTNVRPGLIQPTFVCDYPVSMSPLAKNKASEERVVERFQPYIGGLEIGNAYTELNDPVKQRERFEEQLKERQAEGERWTIDEDYLLALEYGMPPTGGLGIGIDRLVMLFTNQQSIREVILFPQLKDKP
ncbi:MAG: lysine--tRNA ligase [Dehalococcoidales bacterium]|nr:MAG: lysine--tRNA ligase [Dehalococcoidales bacterium]